EQRALVAEVVRVDDFAQDLGSSLLRQGAAGTQPSPAGTQPGAAGTQPGAAANEGTPAQPGGTDRVRARAG
ncbi:MAG TPA: hypothetical protein VF925_03145, partial [Casimicrobiaceae bacterium]